ncbi:IS91 family transposase ISAzo26 [Paraburkholderia sabiae]|nr:IS91 family transposase ISAzo26 [Paraburkholderia sabiae]
MRRAFDAGVLRFHGQLEHLRDARAFATWLAPAPRSEWVVYAKPPFGGAQHVLDYLGRYTHRVAISNNRLLNFDGHAVLFRWKDYRHDARHSTMTLTADEFIRRFLLHVLPDGFKRIRSYGWLANCHRAQRLAICWQLLGVKPPAARSPTIREDYRDRYQRLTGKSLRDGPVCGKGHMLCIEGMPGTLPRARPGPDHAL